MFPLYIGILVDDGLSEVIIAGICTTIFFGILKFAVLIFVFFTAYKLTEKVKSSRTIEIESEQDGLEGPKGRIFLPPGPA